MNGLSCIIYSKALAINAVVANRLPQKRTSCATLPRGHWSVPLHNHMDLSLLSNCIDGLTTWTKITGTSAYPYRIHCAIDGQNYEKSGMVGLLVCSIPYPGIGHAMIRALGNPQSLWLIEGMQNSSTPCFVWPSVFWFLFPHIATLWIASCSLCFLLLELPWCTCKTPSLWTILKPVIGKDHCWAERR